MVQPVAADHSYEIAKRLGDKGRLICIDQDAEALAAARVRLAPFEEKITFVKSNYVHMKEVLSELSIPKVNGIVLDLGVSSYQLDNARGDFLIGKMHHLICGWIESRCNCQRHCK